MREYQRERKTYSGIGLAVAILLCVPQGIQLLFWLYLKITGNSPERLYRLGPVLFSFLLVHVIGGFLCFLAMKRVPVRERPGMRRMGFGELVVYMIIGVGIAQLGNLAGRLLMVLTNLVLGTDVQNPLEEMLHGVNLLQIFVCTVLLAPLIEEWLFRKCLIDRIYPYGEKTAVLVSGLLFGLVHGNFYQFFYAFALGAMLAYVYVRSGNIWYPVILHIFFNFTGGFVGMALIKSLEPYGFLESEMFLGNGMMPGVIPLLLFLFAFLILEIGLAIAGVVLFICLRKKIVWKNTQAQIPVDICWKVVFCNVGMVILLLAIAAVYMMQFIL